MKRCGSSSTGGREDMGFPLGHSGILSLAAIMAMSVSALVSLTWLPGAFLSERWQ